MSYLVFARGARRNSRSGFLASRGRVGVSSLRKSARRGSRQSKRQILLRERCTTLERCFEHIARELRRKSRRVQVQYEKYRILYFLTRIIKFTFLAALRSVKNKNVGYFDAKLRFALLALLRSSIFQDEQLIGQLSRKG